MSLFAAPFYGFFPMPEGFGAMQVFVPVDDETTHFYFAQYSLSGPVDKENYAYRSGARMGIDLDEDFRKVRTVENTFLQDRELTKRARASPAFLA